MKGFNRGAHSKLETMQMAENERSVILSVSGGAERERNSEQNSVLSKNTFIESSTDIIDNDNNNSNNIIKDNNDDNINTNA